LSNISNDPIGIQFQWRKSNTERLFHQALSVNERLRTKTVPLTPEILQPEKIKATTPTSNESEMTNDENKTVSQSVRPHFDWKQSGLENPLTDLDRSSPSPSISKSEDSVFDANKTLDLDCYLPPIKASSEVLHTSSSSSLPVEPTLHRNSSPILQQQRSTPIKTIGLFPGSTTATTVNDDAKRIIDSLPNLSFMSAKALMFPIRFNGTNDETSTTTLY